MKHSEFSYSANNTVYSGGFLRSPSVAVGSKSIYVTDGSEFLIRKIHMDGSQQSTLSRDYTLKRITAADIASEAGLSIRHLPDHIRPAYRPATGAILVDEREHLWVAEFSSERDEPVEWSIFDESGRFAATVVLPAGFRPFHVGERHVAGIWRDEVDVEYVRVHRLSRSG